MPSRRSRNVPRSPSALALVLILAGCGAPQASQLAQWRACQEAVEEGARLEREGRYAEAEREYRRAEGMDPSDPVPLRYLGELHRHHSGDWDQAAALFKRVLALTEGGRDPCSRAVALHGLGKMTVWSGRFDEGLKLMGESIDTYPTALCYRNLAVYWMGEGKLDKAGDYTLKALALEPEDPYNIVFYAVYLDMTGQCAEAQKLAAETPVHPDQSYNRACIKAMCGFREEALALLRQHFYGFETTDAVRRREMKEARSDIAFKSLFEDPEFLELTSLAGDGGMR